MTTKEKIQKYIVGNSTWNRMTAEELIEQLRKYNVHIHRRKNESINDFQQRIKADQIYIIQQTKRIWCVEFANWLIREDSPFAILYGQRIATEEVYDLFLKNPKPE